MALPVVGDEIRHDEHRRARVTLDELRRRLRLAGIGHPGQVGSVVAGRLGVVRRGWGPAPLLFDDGVPGAAGALEAVPSEVR